MGSPWSQLAADNKPQMIFYFFPPLFFLVEHLSHQAQVGKKEKKKRSRKKEEPGIMAFNQQRSAVLRRPGWLLAVVEPGFHNSLR